MEDLLAAALLGALVWLAFHPAVQGAFVYDDRTQVAGNPLIQTPELLGRALVSDVWAFKGERSAAWSNYWRPAFVLWLAANHALFGLGNTLGWHLGNFLLHLVVCLLAYVLLRRLELATGVAAAIAAVFAVHPAHVESVAWISGSPDLLAAIPLLGALLLLLPPREELSHRRLGAALALFALALLAKEMAVVFPVLAGWTAWAAAPLRASGRQRLPTVWRRAWPFLAVAGLYFLLRWLVLGQVSVRVPWHLGALDLLLTAPSLAAFYLRHALLPASLGPSYPLRATTAASLGAESFVGPLLVCLVFALVAWRLVRGRPALQLGLALFALPLLPAFNLNAFLPEQLVHDRYLYLPLLGFWLLALGAPAVLAREHGSPHRRAIEVATTGLAALLVVGFTTVTASYAKSWTSELALWRRAVDTDPTSAYNWAQLGSALLAQGQSKEALVALDHALEIAPVTTALLDRAFIESRQGQLVDAERDLRRVQVEQPDNPQTYQQLAFVYQQQGRLAEAARELERGRDAVPYERCAMTSNLAVVLYLLGNKVQALSELESTQPRVGLDPGAACVASAFHLGMLLLEQGRAAEARQAFERFLGASANAQDAETRGRRQQATARLAGLAGG